LGAGTSTNSTAGNGWLLLTLLKAAQQANVGVNFSGNSLFTSVNMNLPRLLALPPTISFPYQTKVSVSTAGQTFLSVNTNPLNILTDANQININASANTYFENTPQAAAAVASGINPVFAANPTVHINITM
jgi:hypothetical protein